MWVNGGNFEFPCALLSGAGTTDPSAKSGSAISCYAAWRAFDRYGYSVGMGFAYIQSGLCPVGQSFDRYRRWIAGIWRCVTSDFALFVWVAGHLLDCRRYSVFYEIFADNLMPEITVLVKET